MKVLAPILVAAATLAIASAGTMPSVMVQASNVSFKDAMAACPGALAGISFALNHLRVAEHAGVVSDLDDADATAQVLMLQDANGASATVNINAKAHTVSAKNVKLGNPNVACVSAD
jgi:hypothetical protein